MMHTFLMIIWSFNCVGAVIVATMHLNEGKKGWFFFNLFWATMAMFIAIHYGAK